MLGGEPAAKSDERDHRDRPVRVVDVAALERVERRSILVQPACSTVSAYCTQLTTLIQADVDGGIPLAEACRVL